LCRRERNAPPYDPLKTVARLQAENIEQDVDELSFYCWALDVDLRG
jgi:hypothetical protein